MAETLDQIFVIFKQWLVGFLPASWRQPVGVLVCVAAIIVVFCTLFALAVLMERKGLGRMQNRYGPNRVGPFGLFQPVADGIKAIIKEDIVPFRADAVVHFLAPVLLVVTVFMGYAVLPIGRNMVLVDMDSGLLFFFAMGTATEVSVFMAGWSSRNKYSLLGSMRAIAQMISYEVVLLLSSVCRGHDCRLALAAQDRRGAESFHRNLSELVRLYALGISRLRDLRYRLHRGDQPFALRPARRRIGDRGRILYRVFGLQVRALLPGRVRGNACRGGSRQPRCSWADGPRLSHF